MSDPHLIVFSGPPCSGKSTLAADVSPRSGLPHLSMDATRCRILPDAPHTRADHRAAYRAMHMAAGLLLDAGSGAILDASYRHQEDRDDLALAARHRPVNWIECRVSPETAVRRFLARGPDSVRLDLTEEVVREMVATFPYRGAGLELDTEALDPRECLDRVLRFTGLFRKPE